MATILVNNFSVVLARKLLRITAVAKATGIAYHTDELVLQAQQKHQLRRYCSDSDLFEFEPLFENDINEPDPAAAPNRKEY